MANSEEGEGDQTYDEIQFCFEGRTTNPTVQNVRQGHHQQHTTNALYLALDQTVPVGVGQDDWDPLIPDKQEPESSSKHTHIYRICKVFTIGLIFLLLLGCAMVSKLTVLLATSQLRPNPTLYCKTDIGDTNQTYCITSPVVSKGDNRPIDLYCLDKGEGMKDLAATEREVCEAATIRWIWCLILMMCTPYVFVLLRCTWYACFRSRTYPSYAIGFAVCFQEVLYSFGMCLLVFKVLPNANGFIQSLGLMAGVAIFPALLRMFNRSSSQRDVVRWLLLFLDILAFLLQLSALLLLPVSLLTATKPGEYDTDLVWAVPVSLLLISLPWWAHYLHEDKLVFRSLAQKVRYLKEEMRESRNFIYLIASGLKIVMTLFITAVIFSTKKPSIDIFSFDWGGTHCDGTVGPAEIAAMTWDWLSVWGINAAAGLVAYFLARTAAKANIQRFSYAIPLVLPTLILYAVLTGMCEMWNQDPCRYTDTIPGHVFWQCYPRGELWSLYAYHCQWLIVVWHLSLVWVGRHIFHPSSHRLLNTDRIFNLPLYDGIVVAEWLVFNRSRKDREQNQVEESAGQDTQQDTNANVPFVHACITMWHETREEMQTLLNSVFKLDKYQSRPNEDVDKFRLQVNIYFDKAMEESKDAPKLYILNTYVQELITSIDEVSTKHGEAILPPVQMETPYGGRIVWTMPHGTKIFLHLKDDKKIRPKKRWSQVMYMYELVNFNNATTINEQSVFKDVQNTFLLALDGDVDFEPEALLKLVDLMKKDKMTAAVCGRIHPLGSGPMVWYQKFEYALGHWMQKATEHVLGCVLCSPGCFSLFRASALRQVLPIYTAQATEAKHFIQYDQGEDRWLNTLLLQRGFNVEYSAASDSSTFAPEMLPEFFKQRRRWMPSTTANILDLLMSWKKTVKNENKISQPYMLYQLMLFALSLVGGGTIFLMIVGALQVALDGAIDKWTSLIINAIPVILYAIICAKGKPDTQAMASMLLTIIYALMQALVLVGIIVQISKDGVCSPTGAFFFFVGAVFITAAILHPQEFTCVFHGITYFLAIPSMYMLLTIYSVLNLNAMSWGTRETKDSSEQMKEGPTSGFTQIDAQHGCMMNIWDTCMVLCCAKPEMAIVDVKTSEEATQTEKQHVIAFQEEAGNGGATVAASVEQQGHGDCQWMEDASLQGAGTGELTTREKIFYKALIKKYLSPMGKVEKEKEEKEMSEKLETLRNIVATGYFLVNALFVIIIFTLQANVETVNVPWPCGTNLRLEPIGVAFLLCFGLIMVLQTAGMIIHRTSTFLHIIATTSVFQSKQGVTTTDADSTRGEVNSGYLSDLGEAVANQGLNESRV